MKRRLLASLLALALLLGLTACGKSGDEEERPNAEPLNTVETVEGWIPSRIEFPDWLSRITGWSTEGDTIWLSGVTPEKSLVIAAYDTLAGEWNRVNFSTADAWQPEMNSVSLAGHSVWALLKESNRYEDYQKGTGRNEDELGYYVLHIDLTNGESTAVRIPFEGEGSTEGSGLFFTGLLGLDDGRALLSAMDRVYLIDAGVNVLSEPELPIGGQFLHFRVDDTLYFWTQDGYAPFDPETLSFGAPIKLDMGIYTNNSTDSNAGHILYSDGKQLCRRNEATGAGEPLFAWLDVALSLSEKGGYEGFENSLGDFYYPGGDPIYGTRLIRVTRGLVPVRQPLYLAGVREDFYALNSSLTDAVIRFNNTDPEYRIEVVPIIYHGEQERDRLLIELTTRSDLDLLDTSFLPDNALDSGLLADMLPMIDADETISREDFIEPLLHLMIQGGGLYEYTERFTMLTLTTHPDLFPGRENWTVEKIEALIKEHPEMDPLWHSLDRELITTLFIWAATAEFINRDTATCSFDSPAFVHWLELMKALPDGGQYSEEAKLMNICYDLAFDAGQQERYMMKGEYTVAGFPETEGTGSYFLKLGSSPNAWRGTMGENTRLGIMAASPRQAGAWRFVRTLMEGSELIGLNDGIPAFKAAFERQLADAVTDEHDDRFDIDVFTEADAETLRQQVYGTTKLVSTDEGLIRILRDEINRFYHGQLTAEEAAAAIQSKATIYVSEQFG